MPIPGGDITTSNIWVGNGDDNQATETTQDQQVQKETDAAEQAVGEDNGNQE